MKGCKVREPQSLTHLDHGDLAVISFAPGSGTARELSLVCATAAGTELGWEPYPALPGWLCTPSSRAQAAVPGL